MQRGLENEFRVVTRGQASSRSCDRACFYSLNQKVSSTCCLCPVLCVLKASSASENLVGCTPGIGSKMIYLEYSVFVLNKFIVLFICVVSSVWFTVHCTFVCLSYAVATRGIEFDKKKVEGYIAELVCSSTLVVFYLSFFFFFFFFFSLFAYKLNIAKKHLENHSLRDETSNRC
jgi:hypothetical protein